MGFTPQQSQSSALRNSSVDYNGSRRIAKSAAERLDLTIQPERIVMY